MYILLESWVHWTSASSHGLLLLHLLLDCNQVSFKLLLSKMKKILLLSCFTIQDNFQLFNHARSLLKLLLFLPLNFKYYNHPQYTTAISPLASKTVIIKPLFFHFRFPGLHSLQSKSPFLTALFWDLTFTWLPTKSFQELLAQKEKPL